jgi:hypothetical protein
MSLECDAGPSTVLRRRQRASPSARQPTPVPSAFSSRPTSTVGGKSESSMTSSRSSNYERLEGGLGPSRLGMRNISWRRIVLCLAIVVAVLWLLRPSEKRLWDVKTPGEFPFPDVFSRPRDPISSTPKLRGIDISRLFSEPKTPAVVDTDNARIRPSSHPMVEPHKPEMDQPSATPAAPSPSPPSRPSSHDSDPDPSKTVFCTTPHSPSSPLVQYALMIDAGSTGSRIHVYKFHNCGPSPAYEYETFVQKQPGLSAYAGHPEEAAQSLDSLLDVAVLTVPEALRRCTPVAVKATAGLRLLGAAQSAEILEAVRRRLREVYPFPLESQDPVAIMDGADEGVYAWITANYLMDTIRADSPADGGAVRRARPWRRVDADRVRAEVPARHRDARGRAPVRARVWRARTRAVPAFVFGLWAHAREEARASPRPFLGVVVPECRGWRGNREPLPGARDEEGGGSRGGGWGFRHGQERHHVRYGCPQWLRSVPQRRGTRDGQDRVSGFHPPSSCAMAGGTDRVCFFFFFFVFAFRLVVTAQPRPAPSMVSTNPRPRTPSSTTRSSSSPTSTIASARCSRPPVPPHPSRSKA